MKAPRVEGSPRVVEIEATYPLADAVRALARAAEPGAAKVLIAPGAQ